MYKIAIITSFHNPPAKLQQYISHHEWATNTKKCYVSNFANYTFILYTGPFDFLTKNALGYEAKPYVLRKYLPHYDWVLWMDGDAFFQRFSFPLDPFLLKGAHIVLQDFFNELSFSNSVFFIKNSPIGFRFLNIWIDMLENHCGNHEWAYFDQNAMLETIMVMLNETRVESNSIPYNLQCRQYPKGCTRNADCYIGWLEKLGHKYEHRNDIGNHFIQFWNMPKNISSPYRAFGYFGSWFLKENLCIESDIVCHSRPVHDHYKKMQNNTDFSRECPHEKLN